MSDDTAPADESSDGPGRADRDGCPERTAVDRPSPTRRLLRAAGAVAGLGALAGCSSSEPDSSPTPAGTEPPSPADTAIPGATSSPTPAASPTPTPSPTPAVCEELEAEIESVEAEIERVRPQLRTVRQERARLLGIRDQLPGGWDQATIDKARAIGLAIRDSVLVLEFDSGGGTGWYVDEHHVITNAHVASNTGMPVGWTVDGEKLAPTRVAMDDNWAPDVAVMRTETPGKPLPLGSSDDLLPSDPLVMVGHPFDAGNWRIALGHYLWTQTDETAPAPSDESPIHYSSLPGRSGVSGAPVVTFSGKVVGLTFGGTNRGESRLLSESPEVHDDTVVDWPIAPKAWGKHVAVETVRDRLDEWI